MYSRKEIETQALKVGKELQSWLQDEYVSFLPVVHVRIATEQITIHISTIEIWDSNDDPEGQHLTFEKCRDLYARELAYLNEPFTASKD